MQEHARVSSLYNLSCLFPRMNEFDSFSLSLIVSSDIGNRDNGHDLKGFKCWNFSSISGLVALNRKGLESVLGLKIENDMIIIKCVTNDVTFDTNDARNHKMLKTNDVLNYTTMSSVVWC
ncbi:hypothetical protein VNO77_17691 [Canavalia gladiata]|uniref:Uncharacterized protein n=1 Tax=Canavalia gladiata TaxID=3824 RepID=A0AAN9QJL0_CANGL